MITGIFKKGELLQSIKYYDAFDRLSNTILNASLKEPENLKVKRMKADIVEIAFYVNYLERAFMIKEVDYQVKSKKYMHLSAELEELLETKKPTDLKNLFQ